MTRIVPALPISERQTAIVMRDDGKLGLSHMALVPPLRPDMVLVRTRAVALNPTDHKMADNFSTPGAISGCDFAGDVVAIGSNVTRPLSVGDRVAGGVYGSNPLDLTSGAFAQYVGATADILVRIPDGWSYEEAAAIGGAGPATIAIALYDSLGLKATPANPAEKPFPVLVYGGSTATGTMAIQILRASGLRPITTCSPKNFELVKSYGAEIAFDYASPTCAEEIRAYTKNTLRYALDCITEAPTTKLCLAAIGRAGGIYTGLELISEDLLGLRKVVTMDWIMSITIFGDRIGLPGAYGRAANSEHRVIGKWFFALMEELLRDGRLRPHPVRPLPGGFAGVLEGLELLRLKTVSGQKLVCNVD